uniref:hypothetical protein n=1 Tax=Variovorax beijingensis TaxID=2496117 RepID=UPI003F69C8A4
MLANPLDEVRDFIALQVALRTYQEVGFHLDTPPLVEHFLQPPVMKVPGGNRRAVQGDAKTLDR